MILDGLKVMMICKNMLPYLMLLININIDKAVLTLNRRYFVMQEMAEDWQQP